MLILFLGATAPANLVWGQGMIAVAEEESPQLFLPEIDAFDFYRRSGKQFLSITLGEIGLVETAHLYGRQLNDTLSPIQEIFAALYSTDYSISAFGMGFTLMHKDQLEEMSETIECLELLDLPDVIRIMKNGLELKEKYQDHRGWEGSLYDSTSQGGQAGLVLDARYRELQPVVYEAAEKYIRSHMEHFGKSSEGIPLTHTYSGTVEIFWPNGKLKERFEVQNGHILGLEEEWYETGKRYAERALNDKGEVTTATIWTPEGKLKGELTPIGDGKILSTYYHPNGQVAKEIIMESGTRMVLSYKTWDEEGKFLGEEVKE